MPSVAQQDYIVIAPKVGDMINVDAYALGQLAKILEKKDNSIFDVIVDYDGFNRSKIIGIFDEDTHFMIASVLTKESSIKQYNILYTATQYEGLSAVQEAGEAQHPGAGIKDDIPLLVNVEDYLNETSSGYYITDLEGHKISVTVANGKLASVAISEETDPDGIKVPFEEIQKLIGLPITV